MIFFLFGLLSDLSPDLWGINTEIMPLISNIQFFIHISIENFTIKSRHFKAADVSFSTVLMLVRVISL